MSPTPIRCGERSPARPGRSTTGRRSTYIAKPPFFDGFKMATGRIGDISGARALGIFGDSVTTDHISPAGSIKPTSPAGVYLMEHDVSVVDFNSYGSRRGNHDVMMRGTFANVRIKNLMLPLKADGGSRGRRRHAVPAVGREDADLRRRDEVHRARHADDRLRRRGIRHRIVARLGGEGHAAPRREGGRGEELRADPPVEPRRHGRAALPVQGHRHGRLARHQGRRDVRRHRDRSGNRAADGRDAHDPPQGRHDASACPCCCASTRRSRSTTTSTAASCRSCCAS